MNESNQSRILKAVLLNERLINYGDYDPNEYESLDDALNSDNPMVKAVAKLILYGNKSETEVYNEISNYLIKTL